MTSSVQAASFSAPNIASGAFSAAAGAGWSSRGGAEGRRARIWVVGISRLQGLYRALLPSFDSRADWRLLGEGFDAAVAAIEAAGDDVDVVVSAGSNGAYLRARLQKPVVLVNVTGMDLIQALANARRIDPAIALITHGETVTELTQFNQAFSIDFPHRAYRTTVEAQAQVAELARMGVRVVVGPGLVTDIATAAGLTGVFLYSAASVRQAFDTALEIAGAALAEGRKRSRIDAVLQHLRDGVVALDAHGRVESVNDQMLRMVGVTRAVALGQKLTALHPAFGDLTFSDLTLGNLSGSGPAAARIEAASETVLLIEGVRYVVSATAILETSGGQDRINGAVLTFQEARLLQRLDRSLRSAHRQQERVAVFMLDDLIGRAPPMQRLREVARRYASVDASVLILGESGAGKELLAQGMHNAGPRRAGPFIAVNCGALPENLLESELFGYDEGAFTGARRGGKPGLIEAAHGGTLFLDEIGEMSAVVQVRLLRVLQQRELIRLGATRPTQIDIRVIAATHRALDRMVAEGEFRQDLFYRLNILRLDVPPLRARRGDIVRLAAMFFHRALARMGQSSLSAGVMSLSALRALRAYAWPGNVRELENVIERLAVHAVMGGHDEAIDAAGLLQLVPEMRAGYWPGTALAADDALPAGEAAAPLKMQSRAEERAMIERALAQHHGDRDAACRQLGVSRTTLWRRMRATAVLPSDS